MSPNSRQRAGRNAGFTLTDLLVTVTILAVMAGIGGHGLLKGMPDRRLAGATRDLYTWINEARSLAVRTSRLVRIGFDVESNQVVTTDADGLVLRRRTFPRYIDIYKVTSGNPFVFNPRGMKSGTVSGSVHIRYGKSDDHRRRVRVTSVGGIAIQRPTEVGDEWK